MNRWQPQSPLDVHDGRGRRVSRRWSVAGASARPDISVVDSAAREAFGFIGELRREATSTKILAFDVDESASDIIQCAEAPRIVAAVRV